MYTGECEKEKWGCSRGELSVYMGNGNGNNPTQLSRPGGSCKNKV